MVSNPKRAGYRVATYTPSIGTLEASLIDALRNTGTTFVLNFADELLEMVRESPEKCSNEPAIPDGNVVGSDHSGAS